MSRTRRAIGYARVSSAEQAIGTSLRDQQAAIAAYAASRGLSVARFYVEAESAIHEKIERREQMQALLRDVREGDLVLCDKLDRWSRDPEFTHGSVRRILAAGADFYAVGDACDPRTPNGDLMLGLRAVLAKEEHKRIHLRTVGTRAILRDQGYWVEGNTPYGYRRSAPKGSRGVEKNILAIEEEEADRVRRMFRSYLSGDSMQRVAERFGLTLDVAKRVLSNRAYVGEMKNSRGEWIKGKHPPILDVETFARAAKVRAERTLGGPRPRRAPSETSTWILRDVARCGRCGAKMGAAYAGPKGPERRHYYLCVKSCGAAGPRVTTGSYVHVDEVEGIMRELVVERLAELREELSRGPEPEAARALPDFEARRAKLQRRRERLHELYVEEAMTRDEHRKALAKLDSEALSLDAEEQAAGRAARAVDASVRRAALREVAAVKQAWKGAGAAGKREIVNCLATAVRLEAGRPPVPVWRPVDDLLVRIA